jgi:hypothetical protein
MNVGKPKRRYTVEPVENPVPREREEPTPAQAPPVPAEPVTAPAK